jgi:hypothetical protein
MHLYEIKYLGPISKSGMYNAWLVLALHENFKAIEGLKEDKFTEARA